MPPQPTSGLCRRLPVLISSIFSSQPLLHSPVRIAPALLRPGFSPLKPFSTNTWQKKDSQGVTANPPSNPALSPRPQSKDTAFISQCIPNYDKLNPDHKLAGIKYLRAAVEAGEVKEKQPERYKALMQTVAEEEKRVEEADNFFYKGFRSIAWGPTILINALLSMLW